MKLFFPESKDKKKEKITKPTVNEPVYSMMDWVKIIVYTHIPGMDLAMMLYWIFSKKATLTQKNYSKALIMVRILGFILLEALSFAFLKFVGYY